MDKTIQPLTPEIELIILSSRVEPHPLSRIETLIKGALDWSRVTTLAGKLGISSLLYLQLSNTRVYSLVPPAIIELLKGDYKKTAMRNILIYGQLERLASIFQQQNIPIILLKGAYMAKNIYGDIGLRPMQDLDIMCRREDRTAAGKILSELGYRKLVFGFDAATKTEFDDTTFYPPAGKKKDVHIDLHVDPFSKLRLNPVLPESIWESALPLSPNSPGLFSLSPEYQLLHLCHHLHKHLASESIMLYWFSDIHEILNNYRGAINWDTFSAMAKDRGIGKEVRHILHLIEALWENPLPGKLWKEFEKKGNLPNLIELIEGQLCRRRKRAIIAKTYFSILKKSVEIESWKGRLFYLYRQVAPSRECMINRYSPRNSLHLFFMYLLRPFRISGRIIIGIYYNISALNKK